jgi:hypothetical protein
MKFLYYQENGIYFINYRHVIIRIVIAKCGPKEVIETLDDSMKLINLNPEYFIKYTADYSNNRFIYVVAEYCNVYCL